MKQESRIVINRKTTSNGSTNFLSGARQTFLIGLIASLLTISPLVWAEDDTYMNLELSYASEYISEGLVRSNSASNSAVYSLSFELTLPLFPIFLSLATVRNFDDFSEDEIALAYTTDVADNNFTAGFLYPYTVTEQSSTVTVGNQEITQITQIDEALPEFFAEFTSDEFYNTRLGVVYNYDLKNRGALLTAGLYFGIDLSDRVNLGIAVESQYDHGYMDDDRVNGLFHIDYTLSLDFALGAGIYLAADALYVTPQRGGKSIGVTEEAVYTLRFGFGF